MRVTITKDGRMIRSTIVECRDCKYFGENHCSHPDCYPCKANERVYGDAYYCNAGATACMLFEAEDPERVKLIESETEEVEVCD